MCLTFQARSQHIVTPSELTITNGVITSCNLPMGTGDLIIPKVINGELITGVAKKAFANKQINQVLLPYALQQIGDSAFYGNNLLEVTIPEGVSEIGAGAFAQNQLSSVEIPSGVIELHEFAFANNKLTTVRFSEAITTIGAGAFANNRLTAVVIPSDVTRINESTFENNQLTSVYLPQGVTMIGAHAFEGNRLASVNIPSSVKEIGTAAFKANSLTTVTIEEDSHIRHIGNCAFDFNHSLRNIVLPSNVNPDFNNYWDSEGNVYLVGAEIESLLTAYFITNPISDSRVGTYTLSSDDVVVEDGIIVSCNHSFTSEKIVIPDELDGQLIRGIGEKVFSNRYLEAVTLPSFLETIGKEAFSLNDLTSISFPELVSFIDELAFYDNLLSTVVIPVNVNTIEKGVFKKNRLNTIYLHGGIVAVRKSAFSDNGLSNIVIPEGVRIIEYLAFGHNELKNVTFPSTLTEIGPRAFVSNQLTSVAIPQGVQKIGSNAFDRNNISQLTLTEGIKRIGKKAFTGNQLISLNCPKSLTHIGKEAFAGNALTSVTFEESSHINYIGGGAFAGNEQLVPIALPQHINGVFTTYKNSHNNTFLPGTEFSDFNACYFSDLSYVLTDSDVEVVDGKISSCSYDFEVKNIIIPNELDGQIVTAVGEHVFADVWELNGIVKVILPSTLVSIEAGAFANNEILSLTIPENTTSIGAAAFNSNGLTSVTVPNSVTFIGANAFSNNELTSATFEPGSAIELIGGNAFPENLQPMLPLHVSPHFINYKSGDGGFLNAFDIMNNSTTHYQMNRKLVAVFCDEDGTVLDVQHVFHGEDVIAPAVPPKAGHVLTGWDRDYADLNSDLVMTAQYAPVSTNVGSVNTGMFKVYPNPVSDRVFVEQASNVEISHVSVYNVSGVLLNRFEMDQTRLAIDVTAYTDRFLVLQVVDKTGKVYHQKLLKQ